MTTDSAFAAALAAGRVLILDGGLATELEAGGHDLSGSDKLWSARLLLDDPEAIKAVHSGFFSAGADVAICATYQASVEGFCRARGLDEAAAVEAMRSALALACSARDERAAGGFVALSVGPWGATAADGSEYTGAYPAHMGPASLLAFHTGRIVAILRGLEGSSSWPDVLACETLPSVAEVDAVCGALDAAAAQLARPLCAWVSLSCSDAERCASGESFADAVRRADRCASVVAIGVNCTPPQHVLGLLAVARRHTGKALVAYPNKGESYDAHSHAWVEGSGEESGAFVELARRWRDEGGASLIGGCCRVGAADIRHLAESLRGAA